LRITRFPSITEQHFLGCASAFVDSLSGELNAAAIALKRLEGRSKGSAFAYEMTLDAHRYGALIVLDRWASLVRVFGPHLSLPERQSLIEAASERVAAAEQILSRANQLLDASDRYNTAILEACLMAFQSVDGVFSEERAVAAQCAKLGPMLPADYREARQIFLEDLAAR
jgi:hypothetical protein